MNIKYSFLLILIFISCDKRKKDTLTEFKKSDSISYYMKSISSDTIFIRKEKNIDRVFLLITESKNSNINCENLSNIALEYFKINKLENLKKVSLILVKRSNEINDSIHLAKGYRFLGSYYKFNHNNDSSFYYYLKAEKIYTKQNDNLNLANILFNKGIVQYTIGDYLGAELSLSRAHLIYKDSKEYDKLFGTLNQLGLVYNELKEYDKAFFYHNKGLETVIKFELQSNEHPKAVCYNNLGYLFLKQNKYKEAIKNFELGLRENNLEQDNPDLFGNLIDNLAYSRLQSNNNKELPNLFFKSLKVREKIQNSPAVVESFIHLSEYYKDIGSLSSSIKYSEEALKVAKKSKLPFYIILALKQASIVDTKNATRYSEDYIRISDSLQIVERNSKDRFARIQLETDEVIKQNTVLEERNREFINYFFGIMAFFGLLFYMRLQRAKKREVVLKQAQQKANEDIYALIISQQGKLDEGKIMEKTRIAKDLHDGILGRMFGLRLNLEGLSHRTDDQVSEEQLKCLDQLKTIEQDLREISHELSREKFTLINNYLVIVNNLFEEQTNNYKAKVEVTINEKIDWGNLGNTTKINLYRIIQEALQNINKYAKANLIKIDFQKDKYGNLILNIVDDGIGYNTDKNSGGIGIKNMIARTHESDGIIEIKSAVNKGTIITITVPLDHKSIKT